MHRATFTTRPVRRSAAVIAGIVVTMLLGALLATPASAAPCAPGTDVTVTPMSRPSGSAYRPFYADIGTTNRSGYAGWELTEASSPVLGDDVWVRISGFSDAATLGLASGQSQDIPARGTSSNSKPLVYAYLTALREVATAQTFTVGVYNGKPGAGGVEVCTYTDGFSRIYDPISANANKVSSISVSTASPIVGGAFNVTAVGDTGTMGNGGPDVEGGNGVISMAPAMDDAWPADAFTLTGVTLAIGGTTYRDRLRAYPPSSGAYTATYGFTVRQAKGTATPIRPVQNITSGNAVKYTGAYDAAAQVSINATTVSTSFAKGAGGVTALGSTTQCSLLSTWYEVEYQVTVSNSSTSPAVIDLFRDTPTTSGTWCLKPGATQLAIGSGSATTIADPITQGSDLIFQGPYTIPAATSSPGTITATYRIYTNAATSNGISGKVGGESITSPTAGANLVSVDPSSPTITTASLPSGATGSAYSQALAATLGTAPYTWSLDSGAFPTGISLVGNTISGTPSTSGTFSFTIRVTDSTSGTPKTSTKAYSLVIIATDSTPPTVSVAAQTGSPTNVSAVSFTATFDEPVTPLLAAGVTIGGTSGTWSVASISPSSGLNTVYTINLTATSPTSGTVTLLVNSGAVQDAANNSGPTANSGSAAVTIDTTAPTVTSFTTAEASPTTSTGFNYTLVLSEAVTGLTTGSFGAFQGTSTGWTVSAVTGSGTTWTVTVAGSSPIDGTVIPRLSAGAATDAAGNTGPASAANGQSVTYTAPSAPSATVPGAPTSPGAAAGTERITISWLPPTSNGGSAITGYTVTAAPGGATCTTTGLKCTITGLTAGTQYTFVIVATNAIGNGAPAATPTAVSPMGGSPRTAADNPPQPKVTICHREGGPNYVAITIAPEAVVEGHSRNHPKDIIPSFDYTKSGKRLTYGGQNLTAENIALLASGCKDRGAESASRGKLQSKVTLCHSGSGRNWVEITVAWEAVVKAGHGDHVHDIIPPFTYVDGGATRSYPGSNWNTETEAILDNGCEAPSVTRNAPFRSTDGTPFAGGNNGSGKEQSKVTICHREGGPKWVRITIAWEAAISGHDKNHPKDIIPPFEYTDNGQTQTYAGQNWTAEGIAVYANECDTPKGVTLKNVTDPTNGTTPAFGGGGNGSGKEQSKVTICHREGGPKWVRITIAWEAAISGHDKNHPKDIIPPFEYTDNGQTQTYAGQNWTAEGIAVYANECDTPKGVTLKNVTDPTNGTTPAFGGGGNGSGKEQSKVTICHREGGPKWVRITIAWEAAISGHDKNHPKDIIPPFTYLSNGQTASYPGQNWDADGIAIYSNDCAVKPTTASVNGGGGNGGSGNGGGGNGGGGGNTAAVDPSKITICHREGGPKWVSITIAWEAAISGHDKNHPKDIIPPFTYLSNGQTTSYPGQNWDADGIAIYSNDCTVPRTSSSIVKPADPTDPTDPTDPGTPIDPIDPPGGAASDVTICHAMGDGSYVRMAVYWETALTDHDAVHSADIIPSFRYVSGARTVAYGGRNWDAAGQRIFDSGCVDKPAGDPKPPAITSRAITPTVACVRIDEDGTFTALFGYTNANTASVGIDAGAGNQVTLDAAAAGAVVPGVPTEFAPGVMAVAVTVSAVPANGAVSWTLANGGTSTTATASLAASERCPDVSSETAADIGVFATCTTTNPDGSFSARFGYQSGETGTITIPVGAANAVRISGTAAPIQAGQPSAFDPGLHDAAFTVQAIPAGGSATWSIVVGGELRTAIANAATPTCKAFGQKLLVVDSPVGVFVSCVSANADGTYNAVLGYANPNRGTIQIAAGEANAVTLAPASGTDVSRGQPTAFLPGTDASALVVRDIPATQTVTWTVAYQGTTSATAGIAYPTTCTRGGTGPENPTPPTDPPLTPPTVAPPTAEAATLGIYVSCVSVQGNRYSATFGYLNPGGSAFAVAAGAKNAVAGGGGRAGQPTVFMPGTNAAAFTLTGLRLGARPTWTVTLPNGARASATASPTGGSCRASRRGSSSPKIETRITPPKTSTRVGTKDVTKVTTRNSGTTPLYGVRVVIPRFANRSAPVNTTAQKGTSCRSTAVSTVCTIATLLPGQTTDVALTTIPRVAGDVNGTAQARGYSATNRRLDAVDSGPLRAHGAFSPGVTG